MSFDRLAPHYRWMEFVLAGNKLQRCRTTFLSSNLKADNVLIIGEGNGRFLVECRKVLSTAKIVCVDASERMLELAKQRLLNHASDCQGVDFICADALAWTPPSNVFDLIVTHFFLDCFQQEQLQKVLSTLARGASCEAKWLLADFQIPERGWHRRRAQAIHQLMYWFFRIVARLPARELSMPDPFLVKHGFCLRERRVTDWGLLRSDLWERA